LFIEVYDVPSQNDKKLLFDGLSIEKLLLYVKLKNTTRCRVAPDAMFWGLW